MWPLRQAGFFHFASGIHYFQADFHGRQAGVVFHLSLFGWRTRGLFVPLAVVSNAVVNTCARVLVSIPSEETCWTISKVMVTSFPNVRIRQRSRVSLTSSQAQEPS